METVRYLANDRHDAMLTGYWPGDPLLAVWEEIYTGGAQREKGPFGCPTPDAIFSIHNDDRPVPNFRSMSVGDVIEYTSATRHEKQWYAVENAGFKRVSPHHLVKEINLIRGSLGVS